MATYIDEEGNEIEIDATPEELAKLPELLKGNEKLETLQTEHDELKIKFSGLESKDFNFRKFEKASEEEKAKLTEKMTEVEKAAVTKISELETQINSGKKDEQDGLKAKAITALSAGDEELGKELEKAYEKSLEFGGEPKSQEDVITRMNEAYRYIKGVVPPVNALNQFVPNTPVLEKKDKERYTNTEKGKSMLQENFPHLYPKEKKEEEKK